MEKIKNTSKYDIDGVPILKESLPFGLQHLFSMFVANILPSLIISSSCNLNEYETTLLIQCSMIGASISTLIQLYPIQIGKIKIGAKIPVMMGISYIFLPAYIFIGNEYGLGTIFGSQLIASMLSMIMGMNIDKLRKFFPPVVTGTVVMSVGISLFQTSIINLAGGEGASNLGSYINWTMGMGVFLIVLYLSQHKNKTISNLSILMGIFAGYMISIFIGIVDFSPITESQIFSFPKLVYFGLDFRVDVIIMLTILYFVVGVQMIGDYYVSSTGALNREPTNEELRSGILGNNIVCMFLSILNSFPTITYPPNSTMIALTKVSSRFVISTGAFVLLLIGFCPKIASIIMTVPSSVIGGATLISIAMITSAGISLINFQKLTEKNMIIIGVSLLFGMGIALSPQVTSNFPEWFNIIFGQSSITISTTMSIILNILLKDDE